MGKYRYKIKKGDIVRILIECGWNDFLRYIKIKKIKGTNIIGCVVTHVMVALNI